MNTKVWIVVMLAIALIALFVPFVPQTQSSGHFMSATYQKSAYVSPTYYVFGCGSYIDQHYSAQLGSAQGFYPLSQGYNFACNYSSQ